MTDNGQGTSDFTPDDSPTGEIAADFEKFRIENPAVEEVLVGLAREVLKRGLPKCGFDLLYNQARWHFLISTTDAEYKLNDRYGSFWSRALMSEYPEFTELFDTRRATDADDWAYAKYGIRYGYLRHGEEDAA